MGFIIGNSSGMLLTNKVSNVSLAYSKKLKNINNFIDLNTSSRKFLGHTSGISCTRLQNSSFFSVAHEEECFVQWEAKFEESAWECEYEDSRLGNDPFAEVVALDVYNKVYTQTWIPQSEVLLSCTRTIDIKLQSSIGRRARDRRNNMKYDCEDRIVYISGNNLIIYTKSPSFQTFLQYNYKTTQVNLGEISCFCLTPDKRMVFLGTAELECKVMLWDLNACLMVLSYSIADNCTVLCMTPSASCRYLACITLSKQYTQVLQLLQISSNFSVALVCSYTINSTCVYKVKDIYVTETNGIEILTCGVQHFRRWKLNAGIFHYYSICLPERICLLAMSVFSNVVVAAADDGKLYLWHRDKLIRSVPGHDGCILALDINEDLGIAVTGGVDGHIIVWKIQVSGLEDYLQVQLDSLREYSLQDPSAHEVAYAVQSLSLGSFVPERGFKVLIGTQNGDIYELSYELNADLDSLVKISAALDTQKIISISCDITNTYFLTLSSTGILTLWDFSTFSQLHTVDFKKKSVKVSIFKKRKFDNTADKKIFIVIGFEDGVIMLKIEETDIITHEIIPEFNTEVSNVTDIKVSIEEKYLAIAFNNDQKPQVDIYLIEPTAFTMDKNLYGFRAPVIRLDFSTDGYYLMCEDSLGEVLLFELETQNIASFHSVEFEIEWLNEGLRHANGLKSILQLYNVNNKIASICKSPGLAAIAVGDEYGVLALYQLPYVPGSSVSMVPAHCYKANLVLFTYDDDYLVTYSEIDRTILKWKIIV
jgi:WD40 repeat protein